MQNDGFVTKISEYITKKVAEKLTGMCKTDKENYDKYWDDISPFIKYGCLKDEKFCDKMNDYILFKNLDDVYVTLPELLKKEETTDEARADEASSEEKTDEEKAEEDKTDEEKTEDADDADEKDPRKVMYYVTDKKAQGQYISMFKEQGMQAVILDKTIDTSFISQLEQRNQNYKFMRIDADVTESLTEDISEDELKADTDTLTEIFKKALGNDNLKVSARKLKNEQVASMLTVSEEGRRMADMMRMYSFGANDMDMSMYRDATLVLNVNHALVKYIMEHKDGEHTDDFCKQLYDMACMANEPLSPEAMKEFMKRSNDIMMTLAGK